MDNIEVDHLGEVWAQALPTLPIEGGVITGCIRDLQARFNLNNFALYTPESLELELNIDDESKRVFITEPAVNDFIYKLLKVSFLFILGCMVAYFVGFAHTETFMGVNSPKIVALRIVLGLLLIAVYILIAISSFILFTALLILCLKSYNDCMLTDRI